MDLLLATAVTTTQSFDAAAAQACFFDLPPSLFAVETGPHERLNVPFLEQ